MEGGLTTSFLGPPAVAHGQRVLEGGAVVGLGCKRRSALKGSHAVTLGSFRRSGFHEGLAKSGDALGSSLPSGL